MSSGSTEPRRRRTVARALGVTGALACGLVVAVAVAVAAGWLPGTGPKLAAPGGMGKNLLFA